MTKILSGDIPYKELRHDVQVLVKVVQGYRPPRLTDVKPRNLLNFLWSILDQCWERTPHSRPDISWIVKSMQTWQSRAASTEPSFVVDWEDLRVQPISTRT